MKRSKKLIIMLFVISLMIFIHAHASEMTFYENDFSVVVSGNAEESQNGKNVTVMLVKNDADFNAPQASDIEYIGQSTISDDGSYKFEFAVDKKINTDDYFVRVNCGGEDISSTISRAYVVTDNGAEYKITVNNTGEEFTVEASSDAENTDYKAYVAFLNEKNNVLNVDVQSDETKKFVFSENSGFAKILLWNNKLKPLMRPHRVVRGAVISDFNVRYPGFTNKAITFSYDDDPASDAVLIDYFNEYGFKGTFNAVGSIDRNDPSIYDGHEVISHGQKHLNMTDETYTTEECISDIVSEKETLEEIFGEGTCNGFVWPYTAPVDREDFDILLNTVKENYKYCRETPSSGNFDIPKDWHRWAPTCKHDDMYKLLPSFLKDDSEELKLFYIWGHAFEFTPNYDGDWSEIEEFLKLLKDENIWKATNGEVYDYITASEKLVVNMTSVYNPTDTDIYINLNGSDIVIGANETVYATPVK